MIDWVPIEETIAQYYTPVSDATDRPAYLSDESVEDMANANRHDSQPMLALLGKAGIEPGCRFHADKAY
ncbi:MAG: hypothetical protein LV471_07675 [Nitrosomonas sp.]|nr:hypothetical protein [Nitrosomonas sp.]